MVKSPKTKKIVGITLTVFLTFTLAIVTIFLVPILTHKDGGTAKNINISSNKANSITQDNYQRSIEVFARDGKTQANLSNIKSGDEFIIKGKGFDSEQGIYIAICKKPESNKNKPAPCLGGIPDDAKDKKTTKSKDFIPSTWISDDLGWAQFSTRGYDNSEKGTFTAYLIVSDPVTESLNCSEEECVIATRNDHTAAQDRSQDLWVPVFFE